MENRLTAEERAEYELIMELACFDPHTGKAYPTAKLGENVRRELDRAESMGQAWARWFIEDDRELGHQRRAKQWLGSRSLIQVSDDEQRLVTKRQRYSILRETSAGREWQPMLYEDMTWSDLEQLIASNQSQIYTGRLNLRTHQRLLALRDRHPGAATVGDALRAEGASIDDYLAEGAA